MTTVIFQTRRALEKCLIYSKFCTWNILNSRNYFGGQQTVGWYQTREAVLGEGQIRFGLWYARIETPDTSGISSLAITLARLYATTEEIVTWTLLNTWTKVKVVSSLWPTSRSVGQPPDIGYLLHVCSSSNSISYFHIQLWS